MPRYFFDTESHTHVGDDVGTDLAGPDAARVQAVVFAGDYLSENPDLLSGADTFRVAVRDEAGTVLLTVSITATEPAPSSA